MTALLFSTGTARGGTNLFTKILNVSREVSLANDPLLPLFKSFRSAALKRSLGLDVDPGAPLSDHYYVGDGGAALNALYAADLSIPFDPAERPSLLESLAARMKLDSENLLPSLSEMQGPTYQALFERALDIIRKAHGKGSPVVGLNDNWAVDAFPALARAFPEAVFLIIVRDPRASIFSALKQKDGARVPAVLPFVRGWRKNIAFVEQLRQDPAIAGRLAVHTYEELVREPRGTMESLCARLEVAFSDEMLDPRRFRDGADRPWKPNSYVHAKPPEGIFPDSIAAWARGLPAAIVECIEFVCGVEMEAMGYELREYKGGFLSPAGCRFLIENERAPASWRGHGTRVDESIRWELSRRQLLEFPLEELDSSTLASHFLFRSAYERCLRQRGPLVQGASPAAEVGA